MKTTLIKALRACSVVLVYGEPNHAAHMRLDRNPVELNAPDDGLYHFHHDAVVDLSDQGIANVLSVAGNSVNLQFLVQRGVKKKDLDRIDALDSGQLYADW